MTTHLTVEVDFDNSDGGDIGGVARAFAEICAEQLGTTRVKVYVGGELVAERFSEDEGGE